MINLEITDQDIDGFELDKKGQWLVDERSKATPEELAELPTLSEWVTEQTNILKTNSKETACYSCPRFGKCKHIIWENVIVNGRPNYTYGMMRVVGCSEHPDQDKFKGHSTTVQLNGVSKNSLFTFSGNFNAARDAAVASDLTGTLWQGVNTAGYSIYRTGLVYDTSGIPSENLIDSARFLYRPTAVAQIGSGWDVIIQDGQPGRPSNPIVKADYDRTFYSGNYGSADPEFWNIGIDEEIPFTDTSIIILGSISKHFLRNSFDVDNNPPPGVRRLKATICKLEITHSPPPDRGFADGAICFYAQTANSVRINDADYSTLTTDWKISIHSLNANDRTVTIPTAQNVLGRVLQIKLEGLASGQKVIIDPQTGNIEGAATLDLTNDNESVSIIYDGNQWVVF